MRKAVLLVSDANVVDSCLNTAHMVREVGGYIGPILYVLDDRPPPSDTMGTNATQNSTTIGAAAALGVEVLPLSVVVQGGDPDADVSQLLLRPQSCDNAIIDEVNREGRGFQLPLASSYHMKTLGLTSSWWRYNYDRLLYLDCGQHVDQAPLDAFFTELNSTSRIIAMAEAELWPATEAAFFQYFEERCDPQRYAEVLTLTSSRNDDTGFNSAFLLFDTSVLGERNAALKEASRLWHRYGSVAHGDQPILNMIFQNYTQIPVKRPPDQSTKCYYTYYPYGAVPLISPPAIRACNGSYLAHKRDSSLDALSSLGTA